MRAFLLRVSILTLAILTTTESVVTAARIDATKGRRYDLGKEHGPWMIMVTSIHKPPAHRQNGGPTPQEAADSLVYELR